MMLSFKKYTYCKCFWVHAALDKADTGCQRLAIELGVEELGDVIEN